MFYPYTFNKIVGSGMFLTKKQGLSQISKRPGLREPINLLSGKKKVCDFMRITRISEIPATILFRSMLIEYLNPLMDTMFASTTISDRQLAIQRLTALWALNECGLGGVLHAFNAPFTGLLVGSVAMFCVAFICVLSENKWKSVVTSLLVVLVIKALVSPHSSPTAYMAVTFQAISGALIFRVLPYMLFSSVLFVTIGLLESALQRLFTLTILYGNTLWDAINIWGRWITEKWDVLMPLSSTQIIIWTYLAVHLSAGVMVGWLIFRTIRSVVHQWGDKKYSIILLEEDRKTFSKTRKKGKWRRYVFFFTLILIITFAYSGLPSTESNIQRGLLAIMRACALLTLWFVFLAPMIIRILKKYLHEKHNQLSDEVTHTMDMFPRLLWIIDKVRTDSQTLRSFARLKYFVTHSLLYILQYRTTDDPDPDRSHPKP